MTPDNVTNEPGDARPALLREFLAELEPVRYARTGSAREYRKRRQWIQDYCRKMLKRLDEEESAPEGAADKTGFYVTRANVRAALAEETWIEDPEASEAQLLLALEDAKLSKDMATLHDVLHRLGGHYYREGNDDEAARYYLRAIEYARDYWPGFLISTLLQLGEVWTHREETLPRALLIFEWALLLRPRLIWVQIKRYECLSRMGQMEAVRAEAGRKEIHTCEGAASAYAARYALRRKKRALAAAREGLRIAEIEPEQSSWKRTFESILKKA